MPTPLPLAIRDLPRLERPREKLSRYGPESLTNTELLALIVRTGRKGRSALQVAEGILKSFGSGALPELGWQRLRQIPGIGQAKACELVACFELSRRILKDKKNHLVQVAGPKDVFEALKDIRCLKKEHFIVFFLDSRNQAMKREIVSVGSLNASLVHPREVFEPAIKHLAAQVILAHNHPSGDPAPSEEDISLTMRLAEAGKLLGIEVLDHVVVAEGTYLSFKEKDLL